MTFALDILQGTLDSMRSEGKLTPEQVSDIWDCDWEDAVCPVCGHEMDRHDARTITRCANAC